ncbi:hypothetical protein ACVGVM_28435 (plasmid) [Pseudonocardia bannensis]|uniref:Uncharacterized protein n=1 Tax=Pseudonocardia bannensis TaxID=630973 RepID=A0A848DRR0_9PSEU|nr:hypothetical protein [Pseudonocardia bannensis]NMH95590.1 hypothetical protein [Pseudonocardia bannensis]
MMRTARAAEAAERAVRRTEQRLLINHLIMLLPEFRSIENELDEASSQNDRKQAIRALVAYSHIAYEVAALLGGAEGLDPTTSEYIERLKASARTAARAKAALVTDSDLNALIATREFREELTELSAYMGLLVGRFRFQVEH